MRGEQRRRPRGHLCREHGGPSRQTRAPGKVISGRLSDRKREGGETRKKREKDEEEAKEEGGRRREVLK